MRQGPFRNAGRLPAGAVAMPSRAVRAGLLLVVFATTIIKREAVAQTVVDCASRGLEGAAPNRAGDSCLCEPGYEEAADQSVAHDLGPQFVACVACPRGKFKSIVGNDERCEACPASTHTIEEGAVTDDQCICEDGHYRWTWPSAGEPGYDDTGIEWTARNRQSAVVAYCADSTHGDYYHERPATWDLCAECPPCMTCSGGPPTADPTIVCNEGYEAHSDLPGVICSQCPAGTKFEATADYPRCSKDDTSGGYAPYALVLISAVGCYCCYVAKDRGLGPFARCGAESSLISVPASGGSGACEHDGDETL